MLARVLVLELGAREARQHLALGDPVARMHEIGDRAGGGGGERRADSGDHGAPAGHILHEIPASHRGDLERLAGDNMARPGPAVREPGEDHREPNGPAGHPVRDPAPIPDGRGRLTRDVLRDGVANRHGAGLVAEEGGLRSAMLITLLELPFARHVPTLERHHKRLKSAVISLLGARTPRCIRVRSPDSGHSRGQTSTLRSRSGPGLHWRAGSLQSLGALEAHRQP